jgi:hypothetical protein
MTSAYLFAVLTVTPSKSREVALIANPEFEAGRVAGHRARRLIGGENPTFSDPFLLMAGTLSRSTLTAGSKPLHLCWTARLSTFSAANAGVIYTGDAQWMTAGRVTAAGEEVLEFADQMEASSRLLETRVFGRDQSLRGLLRVTLAPTLATHLPMSDFADFARLHPDIEMDILSSGELANMTNREADVAIRVVYDRKTLPLNLHSLKGPELFGGVYISRDRLAALRAGAPDPIRWIVISSHGIPDWASEGLVRTSGVPFRTTEARRILLLYGKGWARDDDAAVLRWRGRPPTGEGAWRRPAHVRNGLASHTGGDTQDEVRAALH